MTDAFDALPRETLVEIAKHAAAMARADAFQKDAATKADRRRRLRAAINDAGLLHVSIDLPGRAAA